MELIRKDECKDCDGTGYITSTKPNYYNYEGGGDCLQEIPGWTKESCKSCGKEICLKCNGRGYICHYRIV